MKAKIIYLIFTVVVGIATIVLAALTLENAERKTEPALKSKKKS